MAFMPKEILEQEAVRFGINLDGLKSYEKQKIIAQARKDAGEESYGKGVSRAVKKKETVPGYHNNIIEKNDLEYSEQAKKRAAKLMGNRDPLNPLTQYHGKTIVIAPEIKPNVRTLAYQEELGNELDVEIISFDADTVDNVEENSQWNSKTYKIKGETGRKVVAKSHLPKMQPMITFRVDKDTVPIAEFMGRRGYLYKHSIYPCIKGLLMQSGYFEDYKKDFANNNNVFYLGGLLCCDIGFSDYVLKQIEKKAQTDGDSRR